VDVVPNLLIQRHIAMSADSNQIGKFLPERRCLLGHVSDHHLSVPRTLSRGLLQQQGRDDADHRTYQNAIYTVKECSKPRAHVHQHGRKPVRPTTTEGHLKHRVESSRSGAILSVPPQALRKFKDSLKTNARRVLHRKMRHAQI